MKVYVFGNPDLDEDSVAINVAEKVEDSIDLPGTMQNLASLQNGRHIEFVFVKPNEDVPFVDDPSASSGQDSVVVIMDVVEGINEVKVFSENDLDKLVLAPRFSAHEYDLGMQLKYLRKIGKINRVRIVGLPMSGNVDIDALVGLLEDICE